MISSKSLEELYSEIEIINNSKRKCPVCGLITSKYGIKNHIRLKHTNKGQEYCKNKNSLSNRGWKKGLTKETDKRVAKNAKAVSKAIKGENHPFYNKKHSEKSKKKMSKSMKKAHEEGRAGSWLDSRDKNNVSYPEKFFKRVIKNNFEDKKYNYEYRFGKFSIDFAWVHKKLAIEIDGSQHERFKEQIRRDKEKDKLLKKNGWEILRIKWKDMFENPKKYINISKDFVDNYFELQDD